MEKKNTRNPLISGGVLINDSDYFKKDEINMDKDSLKASLELVNKIRQQKKAEIDKSTYLKEVDPESTTTNITSTPTSGTTTKFEIPKEVVNSPSNDGQQNMVFNITVNSTPDTPQQKPVMRPYQPNTSSPGISLADLDNANKNAFTEKKDEYLPDYRNQQNEEKPAFTSPLNANQPQNNYTPINVENQPTEQSPVDFNNLDQNNQPYDPSLNEKPKYLVSDKELQEGGTRKPKKSKYPEHTSNATDVKTGKGVAWLAYILFFIPLIIRGKNSFVRWHANEALELNLLDVLGAGLLVAGWMLKSDNLYLSTLYFAMVTIGAIILAVTTLTKIVMLIFCLAGKEARNPWGVRKLRIIK